MADNKAQKSTTLSAKQLQTISAVLQAKSISEGVKTAKVSRRRFYVWLEDEAFKAEFMRQRDRIAELAFSSLRAAASEAAKTIRKLLDSENESIQLRAAESILANIIKYKEIEEIERRIKALEEALEFSK